MTKVYIAGPMSGLPDYNYPAFANAAAVLRAAGHTVISPHELHAGVFGLAYTAYLRRDLQALLECDELVLLPGWQESFGARLEEHVANALGMPSSELLADA